MAGKTIYEKIWDNHLVDSEEGKPSILYIDLHLLHEVTSPQAFEGLRLAGRKLRRPDHTFATMDHNVPTKDRYNIKDPVSKNKSKPWKKTVLNSTSLCMDLTVPSRASFMSSVPNSV